MDRIDDASEGSPGEKRRRRPRRPVAPPPERTKRSFTLDAEDSRRLDVHAAYLNLTGSEMVAKLIRDHLKRFVVQDRGGLDDTGASAA